METRKIKFGWNGSNRPTPRKVQKILSSAKYLIVTVSVSAYVIESPLIGFWLLLAGGAIDEASKYFYEE